MVSNRAEQQKLIKAARNQIRKYSAQIAGKVLLKSVFSTADAGIIAWYTVVGVKNKYGWSRAWK